MDMIVLVIFLALTLLSVPIGFALFLASMIGFAWFTDLSLIMLGQAMFIKLDKFSLLSILFFVLAGNLMARGAIARKIVEFANALVGHFKAGLPISGVVSCGLFGAVSGSALATLAAIGGLIVPEMRKKKFDDDFTVGLMTTSSILGIIIPPSIPMIIYCLVTDVSIAKLFMAGFLPGLFMILLLSIYCIYNSRKSTNADVVVNANFSFSHLGKALSTGIWALFMPLIIFGGIFSGVFTATEAAVIASVYAYLVEFFIYRELSIKQIARITVDSGVTLASILIITAGSMLLSDYLTIMQIPDRITDWIVGTMHTQLFFWLMVNVMLLIVGCIMEVIAAILILAPILLPPALQLGIDPVHFGLIMCVNLGIGYITPPVGVNCFLSAKLFNIPTVQAFKAILPTMLVLLVALMILTFVPTITTILPTYFLGGTK
jgi:tripartite ATP-independent transporter DctM subunit